jgi:hypothetical protein
VYVASVMIEECVVMVMSVVMVLELCKRFMTRSFKNIFVAMDGTRKYLHINKLSTLSVG